MKGFEDGLGGMASLAAQLAVPPPQLELGQSGVSNGTGVWSRATLPANTRFGPFLGKWVLEPENDEFAWEVRITILSYFAILSFCPTLLDTRAKLSTDERTVDTISIVSSVKNPMRPFELKAASLSLR